MNITYLICNKCNDTVFSFNRHDMNWCKCKSCALDGGFDYNKITGNREDFTMVESDIPSVMMFIREKFTWTKRYDINNKLLKKPVNRKLSKLTSDHIVGILLYFTKKLVLHDDLKSCNMSNQWLVTHEILLEELKYRKLK